MSNNIYCYYVYAYLRSDGTPYYIGKGCNERAYGKHRISVPKDKSKIVFLETNLSNVGACALERRYITWYGRKDLDTGILRNMTAGGDGGGNFSPQTICKISSANMGRTKSHETIDKLSAAMKGKYKGENHPMYGKKHSPETRARISAANKGKKRSLESRKKQSASLQGKKHSSETKDKISAANKGKSAANKGKKRSSETIAKISASLKARRNS